MYKADFPFFDYHPDLVYLDSAATTQKPRAVIDRITRYYREECAPVGRSMYATGLAATEAIEAVRAQTVEFLDAPEDSYVVFTPGATDALNILAHGLASTLQPGDEIILSESEHHANLVPWQEVAKRTGATLQFVKSYENGALNLKKLGETLNEKTKVVSLSLVSNVFGTILPVEDVKTIINRQGSRPFFILDASQAGGHFPLSVTSLDCDALVLSAHKMYAPSGVGVLWGRGPFLEQLSPYRTGGAMINKVTLPETTWASLPQRLEAGSPNTEGILGFGTALSYLSSIGMDQVQRHTEDLHRHLRETVLSIPGFSLVGEPDAASGLVSFTHQSIHPHDIAQFLAEKQICVRAGHQCAQPLHNARDISGSVRASIGIYTTNEDINRFGGALNDAVTFFS